MDEATDLSFPMDVGQRVRVHLHDEQLWTVVRGWRLPHVILVDVPQSSHAAGIKAGTPCEIQYLREGIFYRFESEVLGVLTTRPLPDFLGLKCPQRVRSQNLRSYPRIRTQCTGTVVSPKGGTWPCEIRDISLGGCRIRVDQADIANGDRVELSCVLPNQRSMVDIPCEVKRSYLGNLYGLEFTHLKDAHKRSLEDFLMIFSRIQSIEMGPMAEQGMAGDLEEIPLPDLLQVLVNSRKSYQVDISRRSDRGRVYVKEGAVLYATTMHKMGIDAIFELFSWPRGRYHIQKAEWIPERNINARLEFLLLEFARRLDQDTMDEDLIPPDPEGGPGEVTG